MKNSIRSWSCVLNDHVYDTNNSDEKHNRGGWPTFHVWLVGKWKIYLSPQYVNYVGYQVSKIASPYHLHASDNKVPNFAF